MKKRELSICVECESNYFKGSSEMMSLCPNCAHKLYGYDNCDHIFEQGICIECGWNGKNSHYLNSRSKH